MHDFEKHLTDKTSTVVSKAEALLSRIAASRGELSPETTKMETKIANLLAIQKDYMLKLDRLSTEKDQMSEQLNAATLRYFKAEKKLDRAKSAQVQKLEQQAFANATRPAAASTDTPEPSEPNCNSSELLVKYEEATAVSTKQKEQLDNLISEMKSLQDENSSLKARRETWSDEDFIRTDVFKQFKAQSEDLIKRINNLESTNKQLREEAEKLQAERSAFRSHLEADANQVTQELEADIMARDQDLARVRTARDEILAENAQRKAHMEQERAALNLLKELAAAKDERISALESELSRVKPSEDAVMDNADNVADLSTDDLAAKYKKLEMDFRSINQELPAMERAYKRMKDLAHKKIEEFATLEERIAIVTAEKSKADQKYFAARKDADTRNNEIRSLRHQNGKSAEIIAQLKDLESQSRTLSTNLEKQVADLKHTNSSLIAENKKLDLASQEAVRRTESLGKQMTELTSLVKTKDATSATIKERNMAQEAEAERLKVRIEHLQRERDNWKNKALSNSSEEEEMLRVSLNLLFQAARFRRTYTDCEIVAICFVPYLPEELQEHGLEDVWAFVLQPVR